MELFDIIGALRDFAALKGWKFVYGIDSFSRNIGAGKEFDNGEKILIVDYRFVPRMIGTLVDSIQYTCLVMLGQKFDLDSEVSSLDEYDIQKYDRRLKSLGAELSVQLAVFACNNDITLSSIGTVYPQKDMYDTNIDFVIADNVSFTQNA